MFMTWSMWWQHIKLLCVCAVTAHSHNRWREITWKGRLHSMPPQGRRLHTAAIKKPDAIIREPKAGDAATYIERNVRLALTCDYNAFQKNSNLQTEGQTFVLLDGCLYLRYTWSCRANWQNVAYCIPSSFRQMSRLLRSPRCLVGRIGVTRLKFGLHNRFSQTAIWTLWRCWTYVNFPSNFQHSAISIWRTHTILIQ
jgi:hypothetical protein